MPFWFFVSLKLYVFQSFLSGQYPMTITVSNLIMIDVIYFGTINYSKIFILKFVTRIKLVHSFSACLLIIVFGEIIPL